TENSVRSQLVTVPHHRDRDQARGSGPRTRSPRVGSSIDERLERKPPPPVPQQRQDALPISRVQPDYRVGLPDRVLSPLTTDRPSARGLLWRVGSLSDDIGNPENIGNLRTQPIRRLVIKVIGKPKLRCGLRRLAAMANKTVG